MPIPVPRGLAVTQTIDNQSPKPGSAVNFQIVVTNNETIAASNAIINFIMAQGLAMNGQVVVDGATAVSGTTPPLLASGLTIAPGQQIVITVPTLVAQDLAPGTILQNVIMVSSDEFGSPPPTTQSITVVADSYQLFLPFITR